MKSFRVLMLAAALAAAGTFVTAPVTADRADAQVLVNADPRLVFPLIGTAVGVGVAAAVCGPVTPICLWQGAGWGLLGGVITNEVAGRPLLFRAAYAEPIYGPPPKRKKRKRAS